MKDKETDNFLNETYKKSVNNRIRKYNKKKKLQYKLSSQNLSFQNKKFQLYKKKKTKNIIKDIFDFTTTLISKKNHVTEILLMPISENYVTKNNDKKDSITILFILKSKILLNLTSLYQKTYNIKDQIKKVN